MRLIAAALLSLFLLGLVMVMPEARLLLEKERERVFAIVGDREVLYRRKSIVWSNRDAKVDDGNGNEILVPGGPSTIHNDRPPQYSP